MKKSKHKKDTISQGRSFLEMVSRETLKQVMGNWTPHDSYSLFQSKKKSSILAQAPTFNRKEFSYD